jgi:ABC-type antimicrobial peptide transport system permease subunit
MGDLRSIDSGWLRSSEQVPALHELWIAGSPTATVAREAAGVDSARVTAATGSVSRAFVSGAVTGLWIGAAGSAACAIVTLIASLASVVRRRAREVGILRALGVTAREQGRMRRTEILIVLAFGLVVGALTGAAMLALVVVTLARSSTPEAPTVLPLVLRFDPIPLAILVVAVVLASAVVVWRYVGAIRAAADVAKP